MQKWQRTFILVSRIICIIYGFVFSGVMIFAHVNQRVKVVLRIQHETLATIVFTTVIFINMWSVLRFCVSNRSKHAAPFTSNARQPSLRRYWNMRTLISKHSESDAIILFAEMMEIPIQSFQLYYIHQQTVSQPYALLFASVLALNFSLPLDDSPFHNHTLLGVA